jgi:hypothetical protein
MLRLSRSIRRNKESFEKTISILPFFLNINQYDFYWEVCKEGNNKKADESMPAFFIVCFVFTTRYELPLKAKDFSVSLSVKPNLCVFQLF